MTGVSNPLKAPYPSVRLPAASEIMYTQILAALVASGAVQASVLPSTYTWSNVKIGGGGGFVPGIIFNPNEKGLAFAR